MSSEIPEEDDDLLAAEMALGLLEGEALAEASARAESDPAFAASVAGWEMRLAELAEAMDDVRPPPSAKDALLAELFPEERRVPVWRRAWPWQALAGVMAVLALALFVSVWPRSEGGGPLRTAQIASAEGDFRVVAVVDGGRGEVILTRTAGAAPEGRILQVWAHGPGEPAQSVGLWPDGESVRLALPAEIAAVRGTLTLGVSEEPPGGSPTGSPSGRVFGTVDIPGFGDA